MKMNHKFFLKLTKGIEKRVALSTLLVAISLMMNLFANLPTIGADAIRKMVLLILVLCAIIYPFILLTIWDRKKKSSLLNAVEFLWQALQFSTAACLLLLLLSLFLGGWLSLAGLCLLLTALTMVQNKKQDILSLLEPKKKRQPGDPVDPWQIPER